MRTLKSIKKSALKLKQDVEDAQLLLQGSENEFRANPCKETWDALEESEEGLRRANYVYESCLSYIRDYDFYRECERLDREMEERRELYLQYC